MNLRDASAPQRRVLHDMLVSQFEESGATCDHQEHGACADCLANIALDTIGYYLRDSQTDSDGNLTPNARAVLKAHILG